MKPKGRINRKLLLFVLILGVLMLVMTIALLYLTLQQEENNRAITIDPDTMELVQLEPPENGDTVAIVDTSLGEFRFVLYPEYSPAAVKNFIDHAESGFYDGTYVFNSESGVYSYAGSKSRSGDMTEENDDQSERIVRELHQNLWPFRGAVCSIPTYSERTFKEKLLGGGTYYNGTRFAVLNTIELDEDTKQELLDNSASEELGQAFVKQGGIPNLSQQMTIIGQTYEGFDVVEKLASLESENNGYYKIPKEDVMINSVTIAEYGDDAESGE